MGRVLRPVFGLTYCGFRAISKPVFRSKKEQLLELGECLFRLGLLDLRAVAALRRNAASGTRGAHFEAAGAERVASHAWLLSKPAAPRGSPSRAVRKGSPTLALQLLVWQLSFVTF